MTHKDMSDLFEKITGETEIKEEQEHTPEKVTDNHNRALPKTDEECPSCGHDEAYFYLQQTRAADESETRFYICAECSNKWRDYD